MTMTSSLEVSIKTHINSKHILALLCNVCMQCISTTVFMVAYVNLILKKMMMMMMMGTTGSSLQIVHCPYKQALFY